LNFEALFEICDFGVPELSCAICHVNSMQIAQDNSDTTNIGFSILASIACIRKIFSKIIRRKTSESQKDNIFEQKKVLSTLKYTFYLEKSARRLSAKNLKKKIGTS
jgi:hypothetical protein